MCQLKKFSTYAKVCVRILEKSGFPKYMSKSIDGVQAGGLNEWGSSAVVDPGCRNEIPIDLFSGNVLGYVHRLRTQEQALNQENGDNSLRRWRGSIVSLE